MSADRSPEYLASLVAELRKQPRETEWLEFKTNNSEPAEIGEYLSALSNSAALAGKTTGYLVWGIDDQTHDVVGTNFQPQQRKIGGEELESWLLRMLTPKIHFTFYEVQLNGHAVVVLEIERAFRHPVRFQSEEFIRVGSYKKKLKDFPQKERELWRIFDQTPFEQGLAAEHISADEVLRLLDYPAYFELLKLPLPGEKHGILHDLQEDNLILPSEAGLWNITNIGALLFAKRLKDFPKLSRKAIRVIQYRDNSRLDTTREREGNRGYASGFEGLIGFINNLLPATEVIGQALRETVPMYPELAVRELVANALIHQDLFVTGAGPMVEIFTDRVEVTNPGAPLVDTQRFLDTPPKSRNEGIASLMRRLGICEERGSGVDKVVAQTEIYRLPAPLFEAPPEATRVVLFSHRALRDMDQAYRIRACYLHACLKYVNREFMTNTSLRERFGIEPRNSATASRLIRSALDAGAIAPFDATAPFSLMKYVPWWAAPPLPRPS
ncbi:ATP-binding protein [Hymenobacter sp. B1770]|uniref:ATP-binding protein n=1 Tax=Hymenobacter sp. B1770 TaxID=1718788 RepID=UPI003CF43661